MTNSYNTFSYEKAPDYLPALKQRQQEELEGLAAAEQQAKRNDEMRLANAKQFDDLITSAGKFSKTWGKILEKQRDANDIKLRNQAKNDIRSTGVSQEAYLNYQKEKEAHNNDTTIWNHLAEEQFKLGNVDLGNRLRGLTGHKLKAYKEALIAQRLRTADDHFNSVKYDLKLDYTNEDGSEITWTNATLAQKRQILGQYQIEHGLAGEGLEDIGSYRQEFLAEKYWPSVEKWENSIIGVERQQANENAKKDHEAGLSQELEAALTTTTNGSGTETLLNIVKQNEGFLGGRRQALIWTRTKALEMLEDRRITEDQFWDLYNHKFDHSDGRKGVTLDDVGGWSREEAEAEVNVAMGKMAQNDRLKKAGVQAEFTREIQDALEKLERPLTEEEVILLEQEWNQDPEKGGMGYPLPEIFKTLKNNTQQDQSDDEKILALEADLRAGRPLDNNLILSIYDTKKRTTWLNKTDAEKQGLTPDHYNKKEAAIKNATSNKQDETLASVTKTNEWGLQVEAARSFYSEQRKNLMAQLGPTGAEEAHKKALELTLAAIDPGEGKASKFSRNGEFRPEVTTSIDYAAKRTSVLANIGSGPDSYRKIENSVLRGTEDDIKQLENFIKNPRPDNIPRIYRDVAKTVKRFSDGSVVTAWHVAATQYALANPGKELPPISSVESQSRIPPELQEIFNYKSTTARRTRVQMIIEKTPFTGRETTTPGVYVVEGEGPSF